MLTYTIINLLVVVVVVEAGAGPGVVEGGCQPVLACRCF